MSDTYYKILDIPTTASAEEITKAYRKLSMVHHPDRPHGDTKKFQAISEAYETLGNADKKREYDSMRQNPFAQSGMRSGAVNMGCKTENEIVEEMLASIFKGGCGGVSGQMPHFQVFHNNVPINMMARTFPGMMPKPPSINKHITVPLIKILTGTTMPLEIERWIIQLEAKYYETETIYVTIPPGIDEGEIITLEGKGNISNGDCKGDVKVFIKIENDTLYTRKGLDLVLKKKITVKEALCGFNFDIKYLTGKTYTITNNGGNIVNSGYTKTIPNMGFTRGSHTGNLVIAFDVAFPEKLSPEVIDQLKKIAF